MAKYIFGLFIIVLTSSFTPAPQTVIFEGEIHYTTTYTYFPAHLERYRSVMPTTLDMYIRRNLVKMEGPTGMANGYMIRIKNLSTHTGYLAMSVGNTYAAYRQGPAEFQSEVDNMTTPTSIEYIDETKNIAGYICKKALVYMPSSTKPFTVYYTNKIPAEAYNIVYKGLKGFPLYFEKSDNGVTSFTQAISIHPQKQEDTKFLLPEKFKLLSMEEFKNAFFNDNIVE